MSIFAGPIGWIITGIWIAIDIAGPANKVTIPSVIQVAFMRLQVEYASLLVDDRHEDVTSSSDDILSESYNNDLKR